MRLHHPPYNPAAWRIASLAPDFRLEDVWQAPIWANPAEGHDLALVRNVILPRAIGRMLQRGIPGALFALRGWLGRQLARDTEASAPPGGPSDRGLLTRLTEADRARDAGAGELPGTPLRRVYAFEREAAWEALTGPADALLHLIWVPVREGEGGYTAQLAVWVRPHGPAGRLYMLAIRPIRQFIIYPALLRALGDEWRLHVQQQRADSAAAGQVPRSDARP